MDGTNTASGERRPFPDTSIGLVSLLVEAGGAERDAGLKELCRRYWQPVYCHVRIACRKSPEDAKDLTQSFFLWLLDHDALRHYVRDRGKFRTFLKAVLKNFLVTELRDACRLKRGGGAATLSLEGGELPIKEVLADPRVQDPERAFDVAWAVTLLKGAIERIRARWTAAGKAEQFRAFEEYDMKSDASVTYGEVAGRLGMKEHDVRNTLFKIRAEIRTEIRAELANTTSSVQELEEEWSDLFGA